MHLRLGQQSRYCFLPAQGSKNGYRTGAVVIMLTAVLCTPCLTFRLATRPSALVWPIINVIKILQSYFPARQFRSAGVGNSSPKTERKVFRQRKNRSGCVQREVDLNLSRDWKLFYPVSCTRLATPNLCSWEVMKEFVLAVIKSESARFDFYTALAGARAARFDTFAQLVPINNVLSCAWGWHGERRYAVRGGGGNKWHS